ncbi:MAG: glycosyltransferase family 39 protein [Bacteroidota bacterium]
MDGFPQKNALDERSLSWLILGLLLVALFLQLGRNTAMMEEARRGQIALEMAVNEDYIAPTYFGELYYRKPPVFNWMLLGSFALLGTTDFALRLVSVLSLLVMMGGHYAIVRHHASEKVAFFSAIFIALTPTILFWLSILGEIDLFYSALTYLSIIGFYHLTAHGRWLVAFVLIYGLGAVGLLTKGLPSPVFIAATVGGWTIYQRAWRRFFSWQHLAGILVFAALAGGYFWLYRQSHSLEVYFATLFNESSGRTVASQGGNLPLHLVSFPFRILADLAPLSLVGLGLIFDEDLREDLLEDPLNRFCVLIYAFNILPYFLSPGTKLTYIVMLHPLLLIVAVRIWFRAAESRNWPLRWGRIVFPSLLALVVLGAVTAFFVPDTQMLASLPGLVAGVVFGAVLLGGLFFWTLRQRRGTSNHSVWFLQWLAILLIAGRLGFDALVLPARDVTGMHTRLQQHGIRIAEITAGQPLYLYGDHNEHTFSHMIGFYVTRDRQAVLARNDSVACGAYYISLRQWVNESEIEVHYTFDNPPHVLHLFQFRDCE